jgi:spore cortex formation protein SpoVR/YcgB (stage V sporulation)
LQHLANLWGYAVLLEEVDASGKTLREHSVSQAHTIH